MYVYIFYCIYIYIYIYIYIRVYGVLREWSVPLVSGITMSFLGYLVCHWTSPGTQLSHVVPLS